MEIRSLKEKKLDDRRPGRKIKRRETRGKATEHNFMIWVLICSEWDPVKGSMN